MRKFPVSDHCDGQVFFNLDGVNGLKSFRDVLKWKMTSKPAKWPEWVENSAEPKLPREIKQGEAYITFINHITFLLQFAGPGGVPINVITDPVFSERVSPFKFAGPKRVRAPGLHLPSLPKIDLICLSHNHYDHMDVESLASISKRDQCAVVMPLNNKDLLRDVSHPHELDWWETFQDRDLKVTLVPAQHWSARGINDRNKSLWGGFFIEAGGIKLYFAGDSGYGPFFKSICNKMGPADINILSIGAYEPRWFMKEQHMNPADAVQAHIDLKSKFSVGSHFECFQLTDEAIDQPRIDLKAALDAAEVPESAFTAPKTGETLHFVKSDR